MTTRLAIIGGGYAGYALARALDEHVDVTLIEARDAFVHNVAAIRALTDSDLIKRIIIPYDKLLKNGRVVRGRAVGVDARGVALSDGTSVSADIIVAATGSAYAAPFKPESDNTTGFAARLADLGRQFRDNDHVVIVGAGAVGVELAGETKAALPWKRVSLVSNVDRLFPTYPPKLHDALVAKLTEFGVGLHLGDTAVDLADLEGCGPGAVKLRSGVVLDGFVVPAIGARVVDGPAQALPKATKRDNGQLVVDPWLRPSSLAKVFAIGDLADTGEGMTIVAIMGQVSWLTKAIRALSSGKTLEALPAYQPRRTPPILLPLGPKRGASVLPISRDGTVVGDWLTSAIKGRSLFIPRLRKEFGQS